MYPKLYVEGGLIRGSAFSIKTLAESFGRLPLLLFLYFTNFRATNLTFVCFLQPPPPPRITRMPQKISSVSQHF